MDENEYIVLLCVRYRDVPRCNQLKKPTKMVSFEDGAAVQFLVVLTFSSSSLYIPFLYLFVGFNVNVLDPIVST